MDDAPRNPGVIALVDAELGQMILQVQRCPRFEHSAAGRKASPDCLGRGWRAPGGRMVIPVPAAGRALTPPPGRCQEHWFEHDRVLQLISYSDAVAIYFDESVDRRAARWMLPYLTELWEYVQRTYGDADNQLCSDRLYSIHHECRYFGGHPSTVYDASHDFRNVRDVGGHNWMTAQYDVVTHETGHIVEGIASGVHGSLAFPLWRDSKLIEFYIYDVYVALGMSYEASRFHNSHARWLTHSRARELAGSLTGSIRCGETTAGVHSRVGVDLQVV